MAAAPCHLPCPVIVVAVSVCGATRELFLRGALTGSRGSLGRPVGTRLLAAACAPQGNPSRGAGIVSVAGAGFLARRAACHLVPSVRPLSRPSAGNVQRSPGRPRCSLGQGSCGYTVCSAADDEGHVPLGLFILSVVKGCCVHCAVTSRKNGKLPFGPQLAGDNGLGRETGALYSRFMGWFSRAWTVL